MNIKVDISVGELVDKITILEIKLQRIDNLNKKKFIEKELQVLNEVYTRIADLNSETLKTKLLYINNKFLLINKFFYFIFFTILIFTNLIHFK